MNLHCFNRLIKLAYIVTVGTALAFPLTAAQSIARTWDEQILSAIRIDLPHPPVHARNLFSLSVCMYDAWAAYSTNAVGFVYHGKHTATDIAAARREAISYAAYRMLFERYSLSRNSATTLPILDSQMAVLGYETTNVTRDVSTPAGIGNSVYDAVSAWFTNDGALQERAYQDFPASQGGYASVNPPLDISVSGTSNTVDVNHWQPLIITNAFAQNGIPLSSTQKYLGSQWLGVRPFSLARVDPTSAWVDPGPPPFFGGPTHTQFVNEAVAVIRASSQLTPDDGVTMDISPASIGNNSLKDIDGHGYSNNPVTGQPYIPTVVKRGDYTRVLAEFWADGPNSETPPGHWNVIANHVSDNPLTVKKIGGVGPVVDDLEWDVKVYFAINAAVHDAACACWGTKRYYDGWRPIIAIRYLGGLGQSSQPSSPAYNALGLPLVPGLIELVTSVTTQPGGRHAGLPINSVVILAWPGQTAQLTNAYSGVRWLRAVDWVPYQRATFVTPAFPGYFSGHSTFSRSAAEVLTAITGSTFFPGGMGTYTVPQDIGLTFEKGPSQAVQMQWATYYDAADAAGLSRIWGGIHPPVDNLAGRVAGSVVGKGVWEMAKRYFDGSIANASKGMTIRKLTSGQGELRQDTYRAMYYQLQATTALGKPFTNVLVGPVQALNSSLAITNSLTGAGTFYRFIQSLKP